jgi:dextranase
VSRLGIEAFGPDHGWYRPGAEARVSAVIDGDVAAVSWARLTLLDLERVVSTMELAFEPDPSRSNVGFTLRLPDTPRHGYGLRLELGDAAPGSAQATAAIEVLDDVWQSPRHAALTDYHEPSATAQATRDLVAWHVNVVQHYDWMWRHYRYRPPGGGDEFSDVLGRVVSHGAVRAALAAGHDAGIASLAYGSVYGAEEEHVARHPEDRVFDEDGQPLSLGGTFYINDIRPGTSWRRRLLDEYVAAVEAFGFDGVHMDTYGPPHTAVAVDGEPIDFAALYPGLVDEAATALDRRVPGTRVLFNCVEGFPLESVAAAATAALYLELWPPDESFADVVRWIDRARSCAAGRAVIIAAYALTLKDAVAPHERAAAFEASLLLGSVIHAAGAYHHTLAESDRLLVEGYYPAAVVMEPSEVEEMRALWRFGARYVHLLSDPGATVEAPPPGTVVREGSTDPLPWSAEPEPGMLWLRQVRTADGTRVLHLIDLRDQPDGRWDAPKRVASTTTGMCLGWDEVGSRPVAISPWSAAGDAALLEPTEDGYRLPDFRRWVTIVAR